MHKKINKHPPPNLVLNIKKKLSAHASHASAGQQSADWHLCIHTEHKTSHGGGLAIMLGKKPDV